MKKPLTIEDIRNPARASGFDHVGSARAGRNGGGGTELWRAQAYKSQFPSLPTISSANHVFRGPRRPTPEAAAQDYCDWYNGQQSAPVAALASHGHKRTRPKRKIEHTEREQAALKVLREEADKRRVELDNYVYLVGMVGNPKYVKIGEAYDPEDRYISGQTYNPYTLVLLGYFKADIARGADKVLHREFAKYHGEGGEWFLPADEILARFGVTRQEFLRKTAVPSDADDRVAA